MDTINFHYGSCIVSVFLVNLINIVQSVPPEYCLNRLNTSNCGGPPTPVAYYYKPGSRCEVAIWRGCPTLNKFRDEAICSHICLAKIFRSSEEKSGEIYETTSAPTIKEPEDEFGDWEKELESVSPDEMQKIDEMLEELAHDYKPEMVKLHFAPNESTTKSEPLTKTTEINTEETVLVEKATEETVTETIVQETSVATESVTEEATTTTTEAIASSSEEVESGEPQEVITT